MQDQPSDSKVAIVYSKNNCGPCSTVKALLSSNGYTIEDRPMPEYLNALYEDFPGAKGVPQVIINSIPIGGMSAVMQYLAK